MSDATEELPDDLASALALLAQEHILHEGSLFRGQTSRLKTKLFYPRDWKTITIEQFVREIDAYIRWYNEKRIKLSLGSLSPIEYRRSLGLSV